MTNVSSDATVELLDAFADAWNRHDADALMSFMSEDCVFESSAGPDSFRKNRPPVAGPRS